MHIIIIGSDEFDENDGIEFDEDDVILELNTEYAVLSSDAEVFIGGKGTIKDLFNSVAEIVLQTYDFIDKTNDTDEFYSLNDYLVELCNFVIDKFKTKDDKYKFKEYNVEVDSDLLLKEISKDSKLLNEYLKDLKDLFNNHEDDTNE